MASSLSAALLALATVAPNDVAAALEARGIQTVLVCPRAIDRVDEKAPLRFGGRLGPLADLLPRQLAEHLRGSPRLTVLAEDRATEALKGYTPELLDKEEVRREIARTTGAQGLLVVEVHDGGKQRWDIQSVLVPMSDGEPATLAREVYTESLSDAAYRGLCFEARRWVDGRLVPVGFSADLARPLAFGTGPGYEQLQLAHLRESATVLRDLDGLPFQLAVSVGGKTREPELIGDKWYVRLDPGETFQLRVQNRSPEDAFFGVYLDGVNTIGRQAEHPLITPTKRHWFVKKQSGPLAIRGWLNADPRSAEQESLAFRIVPRDESVAHEEGIDTAFGQVTALIYTARHEGVLIPKEPLRTRGDNGLFAVGTGPAERLKVDFVPGRRGQLLAAITLHYRTGDELAALRGQAPPAPVPEPLDFPKAERPGELVPFPKKRK